MTQKERIKRDEIVNSITHLVGLGLSIAATALMIVKASYYGSAIQYQLSVLPYSELL
ncbi:MAG: hypothetical protein GXO80_13895 [Chlorobi bacterium]|nr:hypothetical protein [Chlorobiota bacterium]